MNKVVITNRTTDNGGDPILSQPVQNNIEYLIYEYGRYAVIARANKGYDLSDDVRSTISRAVVERWLDESNYIDHMNEEDWNRGWFDIPNMITTQYGKDSTTFSYDPIDFINIARRMYYRKFGKEAERGDLVQFFT